MPTCEYRHPLRTVTTRWEVDNNVLRIVEYEEFAPRTIDDAAVSDVLVVHSDAVLSHSYPVDGDDSERSSFELERFLAEAHPEHDRLVAIPGVGLLYGTSWTTILAMPTGTLSDIEGVLAAALLGEPCVMAGRLGRHWWLATIDQSVACLCRLPFNETLDPAHDLTNILTEFSANANLLPQRLVVFGDHVTPSFLVGLQADWAGTFTTIERFQPFLHVRSSLDSSTGDRVIARAHLLGSLVGVMHLHTGLLPQLAHPLVPA